MRSERLPLILIGILLAVLLAVPVWFRGKAPAGARDGDAERLIILTPHNEQTRYELGLAFNRHRAALGRAAVAFDWRIAGGTADLRKQVTAEFTAAAQADREDEGIGKDLFFGGGDFEHRLLASGIEIERHGETVNVAMVSSIELPQEMLEQVYPSPHIGGALLYDPQLRWVGVALSSFGIVYNRDLITMLDLPHEPRTWTDLTDARYERWIAAVDPAHSGSIAATYNVILRRHGWEEGWRILRRLFANARYFSSNSSKGPIDVSAGDAAAAICIDFYGRFQAGAIEGGRVKYVDPPAMTAITPDPVSILRGAPHGALANEFVRWLLSREAQRLWQLRVGTAGGPEKYELRRMPARHDVYIEADMREWTDPIDPFALARPFPDEMPDFYRAVAPIAHALAIDVHDDLTAAWAAINRTKDETLRARMLARFDVMPDELMPSWRDEVLRREAMRILEDSSHPRYVEVVEVMERFTQQLKERLSDRERSTADRLRWARYFREQYRGIVEMVEER